MLSADLESGGSYQCRATTELEQLSVEHRLEVRARTTFRLSPSHTTVIQGDSVSLSCEVVVDETFLSEVKIMWRLDRELIITSGY